mmetsp:Transcript_2433/g.6758  ORF Transcript_2433/g.6758 Transcript_2433/m.6758 type:complete len:208 (-) Transcript_2433:2111-2734(-)
MPVASTEEWRTPMRARAEAIDILPIPVTITRLPPLRRKVRSQPRRGSSGSRDGASNLPLTRKTPARSMPPSRDVATRIAGRRLRQRLDPQRQHRHRLRSNCHHDTRPTTRSSSSIGIENVSTAPPRCTKQSPTPWLICRCHPIQPTVKARASNTMHRTKRRCGTQPSMHHPRNSQTPMEMPTLGLSPSSTNSSILEGQAKSATDCRQ